MSFVTTDPEALQTAAGALQDIGADMVITNADADPVTTGVVAPGADQVSTQLATCLAAHAAWYHEVSARAAVIYDQLAGSISNAADKYSTAEATNAALM